MRGEIAPFIEGWGGLTIGDGGTVFLEGARD